MKYIRRSVKYFIQLTLIFTVLIAILMLSGMVEKDVAVAFRRGWDSVWMILGVFAAMSALYPRFGYTTRKVSVKGEPSELWPGVEEVMKGRGYESAGEAPDRYAPLTAFLSALPSGQRRQPGCKTLGRHHYHYPGAGRIPGRRPGKGPGPGHLIH